MACVRGPSFVTEDAREAFGGNLSTVALPVESFGVSHKGCVRDHNEDNYLVEPQTGLWVVADGMGGHEAGELASASIVDHLSTIGIPSSAPDLRARFEDRLNRANTEIRNISLSRGITIGSTFAALLAMDGRFACLWAGDSRIYLVRNGLITQVSKDHSEVQELLDRGVISAEEALTWPRRNVITHAVGISDQLKMDFQQGVLMPGDIFVLNTDGLTAHVSDAEIEAAVRSADPQMACRSLLEMVLARGGTDNVTIVLVKMGAGRNGMLNSVPSGAEGLAR